MSITVDDLLKSKYEIEINYLEVDYVVYANLYEEGYYSVIPQRDDDEGGFEVHSDPSFCDYIFIDSMTGLEVVPCEGLKKIAEEVLKNIYWLDELNY